MDTAACRITKPSRVRKASATGLRLPRIFLSFPVDQGFAPRYQFASALACTALATPSTVPGDPVRREPSREAGTVEYRNHLGRVFRDYDRTAQ